MDNIHWNINQILPYQRKFNFINGPREIGKTYSCLYWLIKQAINKGKTFIYLCRTQDEKKHGVMEAALNKVLAMEYPGLTVKGNTFSLFWTWDDPETKHADYHLLCQCVALSEYMKIKKFSFPETAYMFFDEYMLETNDTQGYVKGFKEPDLLLSIYQTVDRARDIVTVFLMGNNTSFYNPYHLHPAFDIPYVQPGSIWKNKTTLFQWAQPSPDLKKLLKQNQFHQMVNKTEYGKYANEGQYTLDVINLIEPLTKDCQYRFTIRYQNTEFGVYINVTNFHCIVSTKIDPSCKFIFALDIESQTENSILITSKNEWLQWFSFHYKRGEVRYESMKTKQLSKEAIYRIV